MSFATQEILSLDKDLAPYSGHLNYRWQQYLDLKSRIEEAEGSIAQFSKVRPAFRESCGLNLGP